MRLCSLLRIYLFVFVCLAWPRLEVEYLGWDYETGAFISRPLFKQSISETFRRLRVCEMAFSLAASYRNSTQDDGFVLALLLSFCLFCPIKR